MNNGHVGGFSRNKTPAKLWATIKPHDAVILGDVVGVTSAKAAS